MHLTLNPQAVKAGTMQDKTDAAGYTASGLAALLGVTTSVPQQAGYPEKITWPSKPK